MAALAFMPWARFSEGVEIEGIRLVPYVRGRDPFGESHESQRLVDLVLEPYRSSATRPISHATLVALPNRDVLADVDADSRAELFTFGELIAFAGLSGRHFFDQVRYCSSLDFTLEIVEFQDPSGGVRTRHRRRDRPVEAGWSRAAYQVARPSGVAANLHDFVDRRILASLLRARGRQSWPDLFESVCVFNLANTDGDQIREPVEVVLIVGAFQRLLGVRHKDDELVSALVQRLGRWKWRAPADAGRFAAPEKVRSSVIQCATVLEAWIRDFARLRHDPAHGRLSAKYPSAWSMKEHLLLSSFLFPLVMKLILADDGLYAINEKDEADVEAFDDLLSTDVFAFSVDEDEVEHVRWHEVRHMAAMRRFAARWRSEPAKREGPSADQLGTWFFEGGR